MYHIVISVIKTCRNSPTPTSFLQFFKSDLFLYIKCTFKYILDLVTFFLMTNAWTVYNKEWNMIIKIVKLKYSISYHKMIILCHIREAWFFFCDRSAAAADLLRELIKRRGFFYSRKLVLRGMVFFLRPLRGRS